MRRERLLVGGAVQGVGFRPFVYRLASDLGLCGFVSNGAGGVTIEVEGPAERLDDFRARLQSERPPHAELRSLRTETLAPTGARGFEIRRSEQDGARTALVLPDLATCAECLREVFDPRDRRFRYPFTNCTHCGPRYSILLDLPYDRAATTMARFEMCALCRAEYEDPLSRRFHAQPNACPRCGPRLTLLDARGAVRARDDEAVAAGVDDLRAGRIVAMKGLGGFLLLADARREDVIAELRRRKGREAKPLALMAATLDDVRALAAPTADEEALLASAAAPIVLVARSEFGRRVEAGGSRPPNPRTRRSSTADAADDVARSEFGRRVEAGGSRPPNPRPRRSSASDVADDVAPSVAPGSPRLGVMLPSTPLHHLLMRDFGAPLVATSGNRSDEPLCIDEAEAIERLRGIADAFLVHDRPIARPVDDSVAQVVAGAPQVLRRARGYAPLPLALPRPAPPLVAVGGHLKNSVALAVGDTLFVGPHVGDLDDARARDAFESTLAALERLYVFQPRALACDLHPDYATTVHARAAGLPVVAVQHHEAHVRAVMLEHGLDGPLLGVAWDGTGLGDDGTLWGGEFLRVEGARCERACHLRAFPLPGGEQAVRDPRRAALGLLFEVLGDEAARHVELPEAETRVLLSMLRRGLNCPLSSGAGRLFDAVAALLGLCDRARYEGEPAARLEWAAAGDAGDDEGAAYALALNGDVLDWEEMLRALLADRAAGVAPGRVARRFHDALVAGVVAVARREARETVVLAGGCFQNRALLEGCVHGLRAAGLRPYWPRQLPPGDGGLCAGQAAAALARERG